MKKIINLLILLSMALPVTGCKKTTADKPAIVMVAFGTSVAEARKVFDHIDARVKERYPEHDVRWAFTSQFIIAKLKKQGIVTESLDDVIASLKEAEIKSAVFQSLHVVPGQEKTEIDKVNKLGLKFSIGKALLTDDEDIQQAVKAVSGDIAADAANVFAGHGNDHFPEFNKQLLAFAEAIETKYSNVFVCSVEGQPGIEKLTDAKKMAEQTGVVNFVPLMIVAGDHIMNDVIGEEAESWKNIIDAKKVTCAKPLGYNEKIIDIYLAHLEEALIEVEK